MKKFLIASLIAVLTTSNIAAHYQTPAGTNSSSLSADKAITKVKRGPVFRASKEQVTQAQNLLKQRSLYTGETTGKLNPETRAALKKYQQAEGVKVTGTLNRATLEKMSIVLTDKQKMIASATN